MYSSFDIPPEFEGSCARHGHGNEIGGDVFNSFYQWVSLCLVSQAVIFFFPRALWVSLEGGLMKHLAKDAGGKVVEDAEKKRDELLATFNKHLHNKYDRYFQTFIGCEVLNLVILVSQVNSGERNRNPLYNSGVGNQCFPRGHLPHIRDGRPHVLPGSPGGEPQTRTAQSHVRGFPKGGSSLLFLLLSFSIKKPDQTLSLSGCQLFLLPIWRGRGASQT